MLYAVRALFRPDAEARRDELREKFNDHLAQPRIRGRLVGSLRSSDGSGARTGILALIEADDRGQLQRWLDSSPYNQAGLYDRIDVDVIDLEVGSLG